MQNDTRQSRTAGFTLIEVVVALTIAALLTAAAVPAVSRAIDRARTSNSTRDLVIALRAARNEARTSGAEVAFTMNIDTRRYRIADGREHTLAAPLDATLSLLTTAGEQLDESAGAIRFFPDGSSTGGTITIAHRGRKQRVEIDWLTGHTRAVTP